MNHLTARLTSEEFVHKARNLRPPLSVKTEAIVRSKLVDGLSQSDVARLHDVYPASVSARVKAFLSANLFTPAAGFQERARRLGGTRSARTLEIARAVLVEGANQAELARQLGCNPSNISLVVNHFLKADTTRPPAMTEEEFQQQKIDRKRKLSQRTLDTAHAVLVEGLSGVEAAERFGLTKQAVSKNLYRFTQVVRA